MPNALLICSWKSKIGRLFMTHISPGSLPISTQGSADNEPGQRTGTRAELLRGRPSSRTAIVILNWNRAALTRKAIASAEREGVAPEDILVVDNGSQETDPDFYAEVAAHHVLIRLPVNRGYTGGNNAGMREALLRGYGRILIMNNDSELLPGCMRALETALDGDPLCGAVSPKVYRSDRTLFYAGARLSIAHANNSFRGYGELDSGQYDEASNTDMFTGSVVMLRSAALSNAGLFPEDYFLYKDDMALAIRLRRHGWTIKYVPTGTAVHLNHASTGRDGRPGPLTYFFNGRNGFWFVRDYGTRWDRVHFIAYRLLFEIPYVLLRCLVRRDFKSAKAFLLGHVAVLWPNHFPDDAEMVERLRTR